MTPSWKSAVALPLTLLGLVALCQGTSAPNYKCFNFLSSGKGTIQPMTDIVIEVGSSYEAYCLFNPAEVQKDDVYFKTTGSDERIIPHTVVNSSAIKVQVTHNEATSYILKCLVGNDTFMCQRSVFVGYKPQDVENFTCLSMNWMSLNCSWDVPENPVKVSYSLTYVIQDYILEPRDCPKKGKSWCSWEGVEFHSGRRNWSMTITAKNNLTQDSVEFRHDVDLYASVIPKTASNYVVNVLSPQEVILKWNLPHPMDVFTEGNVTHEVKYRIVPFRNMFQNSPWILVDLWEESPQRFNRKLFTRTISDLQPYVEYEFSVRLHTGAGPIREEMWSKPALVIKRTEATQPAVAPLTTLGMFEVEETKLHRDVFVSWQTVDPSQENGPDFTYEVRIFDTSNGSPVSSPLTTENGYAKFSRLENNITYRFEIRPMNREGLPEELDVKSEVIVPKKASLISIPNYFKVIAYLGNDTTTYMVRWRLPELYRANQNIETVTLYWCKQTEYENRCQNKIGWEVIDEPDIYVKNLTGYDTSSRYMFGISVNSHNSSSGIKWSGCIARHGVQQPALEKFYFTYVSSTEVKLKWDLDCKAEAAQPNAFNISYCIVGENAKKCAEPEMYVRVDGESTVQHTVKNLHPYRQYIFNIATISDLGLGKWTPSIRVKTKPSKPSGPPQNINVISKGQTWISLAWDPPLESEQNGEIIFYDIKYKMKDSQSFSRIERNVLEYNFTNLDPFIEYHFEVVPCTRINEESACGIHAADIDVKTKIGVPGKIDSFEYDAPWLKWDHEECNGPNCSYELHYTVNGTTSSYNTPINHTAVSLRDLNISCPVKQGDIPVSLLAVSTDEEGHRLLGPPRKMKITCPSKGSYIILVPFSVSNQYNTNLNLMGVPEAFTASVSYRNPRLHAISNGAESLTLANIHKPGIGTLLGFHSVRRGNGNYHQPLVHRNNEQITVDDFSNQQLGSDSRNGRQHSLFSNGVNSQIEPHHSTSEYSQEQSQENWRWAQFTRQNDIVWFPVQFLHQENLKTRLPSEGENDLHSRLSNTADPTTSNVVGLDNFEAEHVTVDSNGNQNADREPSTTSNQNEPSISKYRIAADGNSHSVSCPLLELMKAKGVEVTLNASNENFELKIKGQGNFFKLLQNTDFPVQNHNEVESELASENIVHDIEGNDPPATSERIMNNQEFHQQDLSDLNNLNISSSYRNAETNLTYQDPAHDTSLNHSVTNEEVLQRQAFINENSNFMTLDLPGNSNGSQTNEEQRIPVFVDSVENLLPASTLPPRNVSPSPQPEDSANNNASLGRENKSFYTVNATKEPSILDFVESKSSINSSENNNLFSEPAGPDTIHTSAVTTVQTNNTATNANEPENMNRHRSRRNIQVVPVIFSQISQRNKFSLLDFLQGRHKIKTDSNVLSASNELPLNDMGISQSIESIKSYRQRITLRGEESEQDSESISQEYEDTEVRPVTKLAHTRTSMIYNLGLVGSFNGHVQKVSSEREREGAPSFSQSQDTEVFVNFQHSDKNEPGYKKEFSTGSVSNHHKVSSMKHNYMTYCPFRDILRDKGATFHLLTLDEDEYQLDIRGNATLYNIIKSLL